MPSASTTVAVRVNAPTIYPDRRDERSGDHGDHHDWTGEPATAATDSYGLRLRRRRQDAVRSVERQCVGDEAHGPADRDETERDSETARGWMSLVVRTRTGSSDSAVDVTATGNFITERSRIKIVDSCQGPCGGPGPGGSGSDERRIKRDTQWSLTAGAGEVSKDIRHTRARGTHRRPGRSFPGTCAIGSRRRRPARAAWESGTSSRCHRRSRRGRLRTERYLADWGRRHPEAWFRPVMVRIGCVASLTLPCRPVSEKFPATMTTMIPTSHTLKTIRDGRTSPRSASASSGSTTQLLDLIVSPT